MCQLGSGTGISVRNILNWQLGCLVFISIVAMGALLDSWPAYSHWRELQAMLLVKEQTLMTLQAREHRQAAALSLTPRIPASLLSMMTAMARDQGMNLLSFVHATDEIERDLFREHAVCVLSGTYREAMSTLLALTRASAGIVLRDFSLHVSDQGEYILQVDVMLRSAAALQTASEHVDGLNNPFCAGDDERMASRTDTAALYKDSVRSMQMLAYLQQGHNRIAWLRLTDGQLVQVQRGAVIGREQAAVDMINPAGLRLIATDGRDYQIARVGAVN